jgi:parallel beta-helix repeat protein
MRSRGLLPAVALGFGLTFVLLLLLTHPPLSTRADPGTYYVREGASGDCSSPTTPCSSIQQAINLATSAGDEVRVATGTYIENLSVDHSVRLRGGWNISFTIQAPVTHPTIVDGSGTHVVTVAVGPGPTLIEGFTIQNGPDGIHLYTGTVTVAMNTVRDVTRQGIEIEDGHVLLENNLFTNIAREGIEIDGGTVIVRSNKVYTTGRHGIIVEGGTTLIEGNILRAVAENPADDYHGIEIAGNQVVSGNQVSDIDDRGIYAYGGNCAIINNTIHGTGGDGIRTAPSSINVEIRGNRVSNSGNDGIDARGMVVTVADNHIHTTGDRGINAEDGALTITDNTVYHTNGDGVRTAGSSTQIEIRSNSVYTAGNDGIDARGAIIAIMHNTVSGCADNGIRSEGDEAALIEANWMLDNAVGLAIRDALVFTITNNVIGDHITASVELTGTGTGLLYHNTLVGSGTGVQGTGLAVLEPLTLTLVNNIVVSHNVGISATAGAALLVRDTLLWGNGDDPISGTVAVPVPPLFVAPRQQDYHLLPGSPAIDAGTDVGVADDVDGDPRPIGALPDVGADEFPAALRVTKWARPMLVQPGAPLTYTIHVTNTGIVTLTATITDILPDHAIPTGYYTWTGILAPTSAGAPGGVWTETVVITVETDYAGPLTNVVQVMTDEGARGVYTHTLAPDLAVTKRAAPSNLVESGAPLKYTIYVTNTGNFILRATITDTLPVHIAQGKTSGGTSLMPGQQITWAATIPAPHGVWSETMVVTVEMGYVGPLTNVVQVATAEGVTGVHTETSTVFKRSFIYLPLVMRNYQLSL